MVEKKVELSSYLVLIVSLGLIGICILLNIPMYLGFVGAVIFTEVILTRKGYEIRTLNNMVLIGIRDCLKLIIIITLTGATVSIWLSSGIVPTLIYYGFEYIKHINYILACFIVTSVVAVVMGTSVGTVSTIGIALIGIGKGFEIPAHILLGAIVSGAFFADRISPISGLVNLMIKTVDIKYKDYLKSMLNTLMPSIIIAAAAYYFIGRDYISVINPEKIAILQGNIIKAFEITPILLLLPLIVIIMSVCGINPIINMSIGVVGGSLISIFLQKNTVLEVSKYILSGYKSATGIEELDNILRGGGIQSMAEVLLIVAGAVALSSLLEGTNMINPIIERVMETVKNKLSLIFRTSAFSCLITIVTCDQVVGIILLGKLLKNRFADFGIKKVKLARTISDSGTSIAPLIPWNVNSIIIFAITGISTIQYAPYAVLCYILPFITVLFAFFKEKP
ncbi:MAG: Na+/H+ antiporter NhaC family protein [Clostridiaceae bacterium]|nr:Na+/H+ antiporter NhaC family protein [Clostridiaceae bacterium]